ncbi:alcohol dehydrogenase superfamily protein [Mycena rosella]|uniref:Alcohol dehydrogenase superfamily protein n=1 Tax=Mycena rosella TaxID=1033263 RepID=A0AAD7DZX6_MYCRO|nr:alcohol dehydrogenase superfamily protein [Mycena rosella]
MALPSTTRQFFYPERGSFNNLDIQEVHVSSPKANEVLVKIHAVSLQYRDLMIAKAAYPGVLRDKLVPCSDGAGEVIAVGADVTQWKVGDRVSPNFMLDKLHDELTPEIAATSLGGQSHGVLTEYRTFPAHSLVAIPSHLSYEEASTLPCAAVTAYNALMSGFSPTKAGDMILVQGTGGVSIFALQFAVASGATVISLSSSDEKLKTAKKLGAKHIINYRTTPDWDAEVLKLTNGVGVDRVIEVVGNATLKRSMSAAKMNGSIDIIGALGGSSDAGTTPVDIIHPVIRKGLKIRGIFIGSVQEFKDMNKLMSANVEETRPVVDKVFPFEEAKAAYAYLESQAHVGKIVIKVC